MPKIKGVGYNAIRQILNKKGEVFKHQYYSLLPPEALDAVKNMVSVAWRELVLDEKKSGLVILAKLLYPYDRLALQKLGNEMAKDSMPRFYKIFMRVPSVEFVFKRVTKIWNSFYNTGELSAENFQNDQITLVLHHFPSYPAFLREYLRGWFTGLGELLSLKNIIVKKIEKDPEAWKWEIHWVK